LTIHGEDNGEHREETDETASLRPSESDVIWIELIAAEVRREELDEVWRS
jgi:hypothetical protein